MLNLIWGLVGLLVTLWLLGFVLNFTGNLIHLVLLLVIALAIYNFAMNRDAGQR